MSFSQYKYYFLDEKLLLDIEYLFNKTDPKHFLKMNLQQRL